MPLWGTCMGMIVAAHEVADLEQPTLDLSTLRVRRNAFGRQNESAEDRRFAIPALGPRHFTAIFIRAPWIERWVRECELLASRDGRGRNGPRGATCSGRRSIPESTTTHGSTVLLTMVPRHEKEGRPRLPRNSSTNVQLEAASPDVEGGFQGQIPPIEPLIRGDRNARARRARLSHGKRCRKADQASAEMRSTLLPKHSNASKKGCGPMQRLAITQMLTETRLTFVRNEAINALF